MSSSADYMKSKKGTLLIEKEKIPQRWGEYFGELFHNEKMIPEMHKNLFRKNGRIKV